MVPQFFPHFSFHYYISRITNEDHDRDIIDLLEVGVPRPDVARRFGLSEHQIRRIEFRHKLPPPTAENISLLLQAIRTADDPLSLIHALGLPIATQNAQLAYLDQTETDELSLFDLMDLVLLNRGQTVVNTQNSRLLALRAIGRKGYWAAAKALTTLDMGTKANALWGKRIAPLQGQWRIPPVP